jgi:hypothetical protein
MAKRKQKSRPSEQLFPDSQWDLFEKSYEEKLQEQKNQPVECLGMTFRNDEKRREYFMEKLREKLTSERSPDLNIFSETELIILASVKKYFEGWTAKRISDFSHNEKGYRETPNGRPISYSYAEELQM